MILHVISYRASHILTRTTTTGIGLFFIGMFFSADRMRIHENAYVAQTVA